MISSPFVVVGLAAPKPREHLKALVQQRRQRFGVRGFAQRLEVEIAAPRAYPEDQPPRGQVIQRHGFPRNLPWAATWQGRDERAQANRARAERDRG